MARRRRPTSSTNVELSSWSCGCTSAMVPEPPGGSPYGFRRYAPVPCLAPPTAVAAVGKTIPGDTPCPPADGSAERTTKFAKPPPTCIDPAKSYTVTMKTTKGTMTIALDPKKAPKTVNNFVVLARYHYFDGIVFHRIIPGFVVQGGDPEATGRGGPGYQFADELPPAGQYKIGSLAMANAGPDTNGSQFFIITGQQGVQLPPQYSLFGQVIDGLDVVKQLEATGTSSGAPKEAVKMES